MKFCSKCNKNKPLEEFGANRTRKDGKCSWCKDCKNFYERLNSKKIRRDRYSKEKDKGAEYLKKRYEAQKESYYKRQYGVSKKWFDATNEKQGFKCAICEKTEEENGKAFSIDHDHKCCSGRKSCGQCVRGLLCNNCNWIIGAMNDDPENFDRAKDYVLRHR